MKKRLLVMAMAGVALAGCVSDEVAEIAQKNERIKIGFESPVLYENAESRVAFPGQIGSHSYTSSTGVTRTYSYPREEKFLIYAVSHDKNSFSGWNNSAPFFDGVLAEYEGVKFDAWVPFKTKDDPSTPENETSYYYWPDNKSLTYAASSPAEINTGATRTYNANGITISNFQVESDARNQYDLLFSERVANKEASEMDVLDPGKYSGLPVTFHHALSCVKFAIIKDNDVASEIKLTGLTVEGLYDTGDFKENLTENAENYAYYNYHDATGTKNVNPSWTINTSKSKVNYDSFKGSVVFEWTARAIDELMTGTVSPTNYYAPLLILPQPISTDAKLKISYMVGTEEKTKTIDLNTYPLGAPLTNWEIGKRYTYVLHYSLSAAKQDIIFFAPSTHDWVQDVNIEIKL